MPLRLRCGHCQLSVSVGWFHYHSFESGYGGCSLLVCESCGTQHWLEHALRNRGPEFYSIYSATIANVPSEARIKLAGWLRRKHGVSLSDALESVRQPPVIVAHRARDHEIERLHASLSEMGLVLTKTEVDRDVNPVFGPILQDRLSFAQGPVFGPDSATQIGCVLIEGPPPKHYLQCQHCERGDLLGELDTGELCPSCKTSTLVVDSEWIT